MNILNACKLVKTYNADWNPVNALNNIDVSIEKAEFVGIMGPSGSGKTTLLNLLSGVDKPTSGSIKIEDINIENLEDDELAAFRRKKLGFVFQEFNLLDSLTIRENILLPLVLDKKDIKELDSKSREVLKMLDILNISEKYPYQTSGGQQQRVAIGRAIINNPAIIFADEPTGNLDTKSANTIMTYFEKINSERSCTILLVTHDPFAASFCKRILFIKDGKVHSEMMRGNNRKEFFEDILNHLSEMGGVKNDV